MRVLHVVAWYEPARAGGGTATSMSSLCRALVVEGVDVTVYTTNDAGDGSLVDMPLNQAVDVGGVEVWYFACGLVGQAKAAAFSRDLSRKLHESVNTFDLVHISATRQWHHISLLRVCKKHNVPFIITPHASLMRWWMYEIGSFSRLKRLYTYLVDSVVIRNASALHFLCEGERKESVDHIYGTHSFLVPNGIDTTLTKNNSMRQKLRTAHGLDASTLSLLFFGRIHPQKNIHLVLLALSALSQGEQGQIHLFVVGPIADEAYHAQLLDLVRENELGDRVTFLPPVTRSDVGGWLSMADLMLMPSVVEGVSMALIESLSASLPVMLTDQVANYCEIIEDEAGLIVQPDPISICEVLRSLLLDRDQLSYLSQRARISAETRYEIQFVARQMKQAYVDILTNVQTPSLSWSPTDGETVNYS